MKTVKFCQEVESGVTQQQIDERVNEMKTLSGAIDAYTKTISGKHYICTVREVFDEPLDDEMNDPERAGSVVPTHSSASAGRTTEPVTKKLLTDEDYQRSATRLGCEVAAIRAVAHVESGGGSGFLSDGRPKILIESHVFSKLTGGKFDVSHPDISTARWIRNYVGGVGEHDRLERAMKLDREAALKATSWGKFQILGMNYSRAGSKTVGEFVEAQKRSEQEQLDAFVNFILSHDLTDELSGRRWADFARTYNGPRYAENRYALKMAEAYERYA